MYMYFHFVFVWAEAYASTFEATISNSPFNKVDSEVPLQNSDRILCDTKAASNWS